MITDDEFHRLVSFIKCKAGIDLTAKRILCETRLESYVATSKYNSVGEYLNQALANGNGDSTESLINILTTNHTFFWREEQHFMFFMNKVLPELKQRYGDIKDLRIWCAASSTGEEPYTIAMCLMDYFGIQHAMWDTVVLATDISTKVLRIADKGIYPSDSIRNMPAQWQKTFFVKENDTVRVIPKLREQVIFRRLNLIENFPFRKKLHVVFCRNVLIYFDENMKADIVNRIADALEPGGYLFIGTTESISRTTDKMEYVAPSVYRRK